MGIEAKRAELKALDAEGNGSALFSLWDTSDLDGDITRKGFYGHGVQEVFMVPHHLWTSGQPPLAKGMICERPQGAVYEFEMNTELEQARSWLSHNWLRVLDTAERSQVDQHIRSQLHPIVPLLNAFKTKQQPLEFVLPRKGPLDMNS